jgi:type II secretory pathway pseudopilin PulG
MAFCAYCGSHVAQVSYVPCASCGNPTNGAPPRPRGGTSPATMIVGIIVGALVLFAILGILAAIAIPNFLTAMERAKQKRTLADIRSIATSLQAYAEEKDSYPPGNIGDLQGALVPTYTRSLPRIDAWTHELKYEQQANGFALGSPGKDGTFDRGSLLEYTHGTTDHFDCDIVFVNGAFVQYPQGLVAGGE